MDKVKFRMAIRYPSGSVKKAVGFGSLALRERSCLKRKKLRVIKVSKGASKPEREKQISYFFFKQKLSF